MKKQLLTFLTIASAFAMNAQVTLVKDINNSGSLGSSPAVLFTFNNAIYFYADDSSGSNTGGTDYGKELWITDGSNGGTTFVKDIRTGTANSAIANFFEFNGKLYFTAFSTSSELWTSNGTEAGTTLVDLMPSITGESPQRFVELGGLAYFTVGGQPDPNSTNKLIEWDGNDTSTNPAVQVADVGAGYEIILSELVALNNKLLMYMNYSTDDATIGNELYEYDPATDSFNLIKDITGDATDSSISNLTVVGNEVYFEALDVLWKTDGTTVGTNSVSAAASLTGVTSFFEWNGKLYFEGDTGTSGDQLWVYDPIGDTITNISNVTGGTVNDHNPSDYAALNGYLYYGGQVADDTAKYLFRTNGTITERLSSTINAINDLAVLNDVLYFQGNDGISGNELYKLDPTTLAVGDNKLEIVSVYPNPASDYLMVPNSLIGATYAIYDITGKVLKEGSIDSEKINLNLNSGIYMFKVETELSTVTKKIIVE